MHGDVGPCSPGPSNAKDYNKDTFQLDEKCFVGHVRTIFPQLTHEDPAATLTSLKMTAV